MITTELTLEVFLFLTKQYGYYKCFTYSGLSRIYDYICEITPEGGNVADVTSYLQIFTEFEKLEDVWTEYEPEDYMHNIDVLGRHYTVLKSEIGSYLISE